MFRNLLDVFANVGGMNEHMFSNAWIKNKWIFPPSNRCNKKHHIPKVGHSCHQYKMQPSTSIQINMMEE
jgi:hypothetical protein